MADKQKIRIFWSWFHSIAGSLSVNIEDPILLRELDVHLQDLNPDLSWELGPGGCEPWQLVISPNLNRELQRTAQEIISHAPVIHGWEFHPARRPKDWDYRFIMHRSEGDAIQLDASGWKFILLQYPDGTHEILLEDRSLPTLSEDERWQAAAITLESILGEKLLLEKISEFTLVNKLESRFAGKERPIQHLRKMLLASD